MVAQATTSPNFASPQGEGFPPSPEVDTNLKTHTKTAKIAAHTCARSEGLRGKGGCQSR